MPGDTLKKTDAEWQADQKIAATKRVTEAIRDGTPVTVECSFLQQDFTKPNGRAAFSASVPVYKFGVDWLVPARDLARVCGEEESTCTRAGRGEVEGKVADPRLLFDPEGRRLSAYATLAWAIIQIQHATEIKSAKRKALKLVFLNQFASLTEYKLNASMTSGTPKKSESEKKKKKSLPDEVDTTTTHESTKKQPARTPQQQKTGKRPAAAAEAITGKGDDEKEPPKKKKKHAVAPQKKDPKPAEVAKSQRRLAIEREALRTKVAHAWLNEIENTPEGEDDDGRSEEETGSKKNKQKAE